MEQTPGVDKLNITAELCCMSTLQHLSVFQSGISVAQLWGMMM